MARLFRYSILFIVIFLYTGGCSPEVMHWFYQTGIVVDDYRFGDLYRLSNLPQFKDPQQPCPPESPPVIPNAERVHLYIIGDSFTEPQRISRRDFPVGYYRYTHWEKQSRVQLDTNRHNVLILETVERHFREHFSKAVTNLRIVKDTTYTPAVKSEDKLNLRYLSDQIKSTGFEERMETVLFSQDIFMWFKEVKAQFNFYFFDRISPKVGKSKDSKHLFAGLDTDTTTISSSFNPLPDSELNLLVDSLNTVYKRYQSLGFDEVYLAIIPNKASILDPSSGPYNHLIERVQQHPRLHIPTIDIYTSYAASPQAVYAIGDSHWNCQGRALWLKAVNSKLVISKRNKTI